MTPRASRTTVARARLNEVNVKLRFRKADPIKLPPCILPHILANNIKALQADGDSMGTNERLQASFTSYSNAIRQILHLLRNSDSRSATSNRFFEQAAQTHLNTTLFRKFFQQIAPDLTSFNLFEKIEDLNPPPIETCEILNGAMQRLSEFCWQGDEITLEEFALVAAMSPTQNSMGAYFTPPPLASQICQETIANWIIPLLPDALRKRLPAGIQETLARRNYCTGPDVEVFLTQLTLCCQNCLEGRDLSEIEIKTLSLYISKCLILDPACGSGIFLAEAAKILFTLSRQLNELLGNRTPDNVLARELCTKNLYGIDLVPEYARVARNLVFCKLLPHLKQEDVLPAYNALSQHIQVGNFLLSPFRENFKEQIPQSLNFKILIEVATCFLDLIPNNPEWKSKGLAALENYARGPIEAIPNTSWEQIAANLGISRGTISKTTLSKTVLEALIPPLKLEPGYDIILGNPPQEGARKETGRQQLTSWTTRIQRVCIRYLHKMHFYPDLQGAWDFSLPFICQAIELLKPNGTLAFILPRAIGTQSFASRFLTKNVIKIRRVAYFNLQSNAIFEFWNPFRRELSPAGNDFLTLSCINSPLDAPHYKVEELSPLEYLGDPDASEIRHGEDVARYLAQPPNMPRLHGIPLKFFVTITKGATLCAKAEWRRTRGSFKTRDLVSNARDSNHPLRFVEPSHIGPFFIAGESFLEFRHAQYPDRVPANIHRWREDTFFHGPVLVTPLSKRVPSFALIPENFEDGAWRSPETVVLFKRWVDWFREFPENLPTAIERMKTDTINALQKSGIPTSVIPSDIGAKILGELSAKMPLEVLALVLSSPAVHELRLKGGKSFGKFEAGDWENIALPVLDEKEIDILLDLYHEITRILATVSKNASQSGTLPKNLIKLLEAVLFKDLRALSKVNGKEGAVLGESLLVRKQIDQCFRLIANAYARTKGTLEEMLSFLRK